MKLHQNNRNYNIIGTDDIFVSSNNSNIGENLTNVLQKQDEDLSNLKRNVKWLYKYGGVGGSGTGSGSSKLKANFVLSYTDVQGNKVQSKISEGNSFVIQKGSKIEIVATIISNKNLNEYLFSVNNLQTIIKSTDINKQISTTPTENTLYTITLVGETTINLNFSVYTDIQYIQSQIVTPNNIIIINNQSVYQSYINGSYYNFKIINYKPSTFNSSIDSVFINDNKITKYEIEDVVDSSSGYRTQILKILIQDHFTQFGIYNIQVNYTFGEENFIQNDQFIYQSDDAFVYCYADNINIYSKKTSNPITSKTYNNIIKYKIYPGRNDSITKKYRLNINVEGKQSSVILGSNIVQTYSIVNNLKEDSIKEIPINFTLDDSYSFTYYTYFKKPDEINYFFKDNDGKTYYQAVYCNTEELNDDIIEFPSKDPTLENTINIYKQQSYKLKLCSDKFSEITEINSVDNFIQGKPSDYGPLKVDGLFSFGIKYGGSNYLLPIISIKDKTNELTLYKNKLQFGLSYTDKVCIPDDGKYHLVQLYFKSDYSVLKEEINSTNCKQTVCLFIDGVLETTPFEIQNFYIEKDIEVIYHPGQWQFNHLGVATFNGKPQSIETTNDIKSVAKYLYDIDPIIPSNYYQTYCTKVLERSLSQVFDKSIYEVLSEHGGSSYKGLQWINYFNHGDGNFGKFIGIDPNAIKDLIPTDMEIYCIAPESTKLEESESGLVIPSENINQLLYNTVTSFGESSKIAKIKCNLQKWKGQQFENLFNDELSFYVTYQGSSTLLYSVKNFEVGVDPIMDEDGEYHNVFFTPDVNTFPFLETSFNFKADLVDSSHSNNVIIGNFVNDYMKSPFDTNDNVYKSCLTGKPVLLFMQNNVKNGDETIDDSYVLLGIYSLNLNRSSTNSLGYSKLIDGNKNEITPTDSSITDERCCDSISKYYIMKSTDEQISVNDFAVAEVQDNGILYDYSQFDASLLSKQVLGNYYRSQNNRLYYDWTDEFVKPFKTLSKIVYNYFLKQQATGKSVFNKELYNFSGSELINHQDYYYTKDNNLQNVPDNAVVISSSTINNLSTDKTPYKHYDENKIVFINNPLFQFHLICDNLGEPINNNNQNYYYVEELEDLQYNPDQENCSINVESVVKYYIVCMAFAMVDSVQKNLTLKCPNLKENDWHLGFYDMDTAFGINNSGGKTSFQAFSDYVESDGSIIQDYSPEQTGLYDTPSSFLFIYAKYIDLLVGTNDPFSDVSGGIYPHLEWSKLRSVGKAFESGTKFCEKYVDNYFGEINPLIWNLNYLYKYFSHSLNNTADSEQSRFNGTRKYERKEYLEKRYQYLDVLFGFKNPKYIGNSTIKITNNIEDIPANSNIKINSTMFPQFIKGASSPSTGINVTVKENPKTPIVLQISESISRLFLTNDEGIAEINGKIGSNTAVGFFGTTELQSVSECGQFLMNSEQNTNTIINNKIEAIKISVSKNDSNLYLNLNDLQSVQEISISSANRLVFNNININYSGDQIRTLNKLLINNVECSSITINGNIEINNLTTTNIKSGQLILSNLKVINYIQSNNQLNNITFDAFTYNSELDIVCNSTKILNISNSNIDRINITKGTTIETLNLEGTFTQYFNLDSCANLSTINFLNLECYEIYLNQVYNRTDRTFVNNNIDTLNFNLSNKVNEISLSLPGFVNLKTIQLKDSVKTINLKDYGFSSNILLSNVPDINYNAEGKDIFYQCNSLPKQILLKINTYTDTDISGLFAKNDVIDSTFLKDFFGNGRLYKGNNISGLFTECQNINILYKENSNLTQEFLDIEENICNFANGNKLNCQYMFYLSTFNILTKKIANLLNESTYNSFLGSDSEGSQYIETEAFSNFSKIIFSGGSFYNSWQYYNQRFFNRSENNSTNVLKNYNTEDIFGIDNEKITLLQLFNPYCSKDYSINFETGLPKNLDSISMYCYSTHLENFSNIEKLFDKCVNKPTLSNSFTNNSNNINNRVNLLDFLFKRIGSDIELKVKLDNTISTNHKLSFYKTVNSDDLLQILKYFNNKLNINYLFWNSIVTGATSNLLDYQLNSFKEGCKAFQNCIFKNINGETLPIDINKAFNIENDEKFAEYVNTQSMFEECNLVYFKNRLSVINVEKANRMFAETIYDYTGYVLGSHINSGYDANGVYKIEVYENQRILPVDFFRMIKSNGNINEMFYRSNFDSASLTGFIPDDNDDLEENDLGLKNTMQKDNLFVNTNICYRFYETSDNKNKYRVFPSWYSKMSMQNKYKVYIPWPIGGDDNQVYLFEDRNSINGSYGVLPQFPPKFEDNDGHLSSITKQFRDTDRYYYIVEGDTLPNIQTNNNYNGIMHYYLTLLLKFTNYPTTVIEGLNNTPTDKLVITGTEPSDHHKLYTFGGNGLKDIVAAELVSEETYNQLF